MHSTVRACSRFAMIAAVALTVIIPSPAKAAQCGGNFASWLSKVKAEASSMGISRQAVAALNSLTYDKRVIRFDRRQSHFSQTFLQFATKRAENYRLSRGRQEIRKRASMFKRIERDFGVPAPVIVAFWALETDFGKFQGDFDTIRSLATLAYDCRRPERFRAELFASLKLLQRGDLRRNQMVGAWAGELGQTQFLPHDYVTAAVDYDGDGRRDLINSKPDVLASTGNLLKQFGWKRGQPWLHEVRVPRRMPWKEADLAIRHPRSQWAKWGVVRANGRPLKADGLKAALHLPMGRNGPAFLAYGNFMDVYLKWNQSLTYSTTAAYLATRISGAARMGNGRAKVAALSYNQVKQMQQKLISMGYDVGGADGRLGAGTRKAVKQVQLKLGMPADSYPTQEFLRRLR